MKKIISCFICLCFVLFLCSCNEEQDYEGQIKVTYHLEGGTYMNCTLPVVLYFTPVNEDVIFICPPDELSRKEITKSGYDLVGWYKTKVEDGENVTYIDEFDFKKDTVGKDGITLYACWEKKTAFTYDVCYKDSNGETVVLGTYKVQAGDKFDDYLNYANKNYGYTALGFYDEEGNEWDKEFTHPGGTDSLSIKVYVNYLDGEYLIVKSASDLKTTISASTNIYLAADIDLGGKELCFKNYKGHLIGNGHTISNFKLKYSTLKDDLVQDFEYDSKNSLCLSLFGSTKDAIVEDVTFDNVTFTLETTYRDTYKIYVAPLAVSMENTTIKNVTFNGTIDVKTLPKDFDSEENLIIVHDSIYYLKDESSTIENNNVDINVVFTNKTE